MNKNIFRENARRAAALLLIITLLFSLSSCFTINLSNTATKEEITENVAASIENNTKQYTYVADYLSYWGMPKFNASKFKWYEAMYKRYYNYEGGLPEVFEHAVSVAELFLSELYDVTNLKSKDEVTDALLTVYSVTVGDPYSIYRNTEDSNFETDDMNGVFTGIGIQVEHNVAEDTTIIVAILQNSPAETAGFEIGDHIYAVDGVTVEEVGYSQAMKNIRGPIGTEVTVTVLRDGNQLDIKAIRDLVVEITIEYEVTEDGYGYVRIFSFKDNTAEQFKVAIEMLKRANVKGIIFDLRNNPGGYVHTVCEMLSYLLPSGLDLMSYNYKDGTGNIEKSETDLIPVLDDNGVQKNDADGNPLYDEADSTVDLPMVVICNEYTASSAEIFTSALRDHREEGVVTFTSVGTTTYKKGIMQFSVSYTDGSTATFTVAYYCPPSGVNYHGVGITPDVVIELTEEGDVQYDAAVSELEKLINANNN